MLWWAGIYSIVLDANIFLPSQPDMKMGPDCPSVWPPHRGRRLTDSGVGKIGRCCSWEEKGQPLARAWQVTYRILPLKAIIILHLSVAFSCYIIPKTLTMILLWAVTVINVEINSKLINALLKTGRSDSLPSSKPYCDMVA